MTDTGNSIFSEIKYMKINKITEHVMLDTAELNNNSLSQI